MHHDDVQFCSCSFSGDFQPEDSLDGQVSEEAFLFIFHFHHCSVSAANFRTCTMHFVQHKGLGH